MDIIKKLYGENCIYDKLVTIKSTNFEIKDYYNSVIPLNLYLTWSIKKLPPKMQENVNIMIKVNPEFNIQIFDCDERREFIKKNFSKDILTVYDTLIPGAYKADLWRLCILYINGGIYADIKLNCINNFKFIALTEREHFVLDIFGQSKEEEIGLWNGLIVVKPKNILLLICINKISKNVKNKNYGYNYLYPTGPGLLGQEYIKKLRENDSTIESELNKLDLCLEKNKQIIFNNVPILNFYKEYRDEQNQFAITQHYAELYRLKQIYNEAEESHNNEAEESHNNEKYVAKRQQNYNMNIVEKVYGENGIYNKLKTIKSTNFEIKDFYNSVIPLNLYLTWDTKELPIKMQDNVDRIRINNPEFNIQLFDDYDCREFIKKHFSKDILTAFDTLKPGAYKADLWRLCILYINGGIYCDIKFNSINNFKFIALTEKEHFILDRPGYWKEGEIGLHNSVLVAKSKNILFLKCINKISENVKNKKYDYNSLYPTGPGFLGEEYIKILRINESTIEVELNKLDLCLDNHLIIFNNVPIFETYKEYRDEQNQFAKTQHYTELYRLKQIYNEDIKPLYNEVIEPFYNNEEYVAKRQQNYNIFNKYNLILFCGIIIILFCIFFKL